MQAKSALRVVGAGLIILGFGASAATVSAAISPNHTASVSAGAEQRAAFGSAPVPLQMAQRATPYTAAPPLARPGPRRLAAPNTPLTSRVPPTPVNFRCPPPQFLDPFGPPFGPPAFFPPPFSPCPVSP